MPRRCYRWCSGTVTHSGRYTQPQETSPGISSENFHIHRLTYRPPADTILTPVTVSHWQSPQNRESRQWPRKPQCDTTHNLKLQTATQSQFLVFHTCRLSRECSVSQMDLVDMRQSLLLSEITTGLACDRRRTELPRSLLAIDTLRRHRGGWSAAFLLSPHKTGRSPQWPEPTRSSASKTPPN